MNSRPSLPRGNLKKIQPFPGVSDGALSKIRRFHSGPSVNGRWHNLFDRQTLLQKVSGHTLEYLKINSLDILIFLESSSTILR